MAKPSPKPVEGVATQAIMDELITIEQIEAKIAYLRRDDDAERARKARIEELEAKVQQMRDDETAYALQQEIDVHVQQRDAAWADFERQIEPLRAQVVAMRDAFAAALPAYHLAHTQDGRVNSLQRKQKGKAASAAPNLESTLRRIIPDFPMWVEGVLRATKVAERGVLQAASLAERQQAAVERQVEAMIPTDWVGAGAGPIAGDE